MDSLLGKTEELFNQNQNLQQNRLLIDKNNKQNEALLEQTERLDIGSTLEVFDIEIDKLKLTSHGQERSVIWAKNIQILRFCFKISANQISNQNKNYLYPINQVPMVMFYNLVVLQKTLLSQLKMRLYLLPH